MAEDRPAVLKDWIDELRQPRKPLTAWELSFVESLSEQLERARPLSERQVEILERLYTEKT